MNRLEWAGFGVALAIATILGVLIISLCVAAFAHEAPQGWSYDPACCSGADCRPLPNGMVEPTTAGWLVKFTGETVPYNDKKIRHSGDQNFHWCAMSAKNKEFMKGPTRCLYVPDFGS